MCVWGDSSREGLNYIGRHARARQAQNIEDHDAHPLRERTIERFSFGIHFTADGCCFVMAHGQIYRKDGAVGTCRDSPSSDVRLLQQPGQPTCKWIGSNWVLVSPFVKHVGHAQCWSMSMNETFEVQAP